MATDSPPPYISTPRPKRILIIGGGVAGLAALKVLVEEKGVGPSGAFDQVELIERRDNIGGVWYVDDEVLKQEKQSQRRTCSGQWPITFESNKTICSKKTHNGQVIYEEKQITIGSQIRPCWPSPAYSGLHGNVLPRFLTLSGGPAFPTPADLDDPFPTLSETQNYLELVAKPLQSHIRCNMECVEVRELPGEQQGQNRWAVRLRNWNVHCEEEHTEYFDAVVLTVGWTDRPFYPRISGLKEAKLAGLIDHCKWYRGPETYSVDNRIVVVGNANSGNDIAAQLASLRMNGKHEVIYRIARHKSWDYIVSLRDPLILDVPALQSLSISEDGSKVHVGLAGGKVIENVDRVILASGYEIAKISFVHLLCRQPDLSECPYLPSSCSKTDNWQWSLKTSPSTMETLWRPLSSPPPGTCFNTTDNPERIPDLFWQFLHARAATLALINMCPTRIPFWTSDVQSHCLRAIWDGSMTSFPVTLESRLDYQSRRLKWLAQMKKEEPKRIKMAKEKNMKEQDSVEKHLYLPPEHTATPTYHSLGLRLDDYGPPLRRMAISAKSEWATKLPDWDLHADERKEMHKLRMIALETRRDQGIKMN